jgi:hypothetical protein
LIFFDEITQKKNEISIFFKIKKGCGGPCRKFLKSMCKNTLNLIKILNGLYIKGQLDRFRADGITAIHVLFFKEKLIVKLFWYI